MNTYSFEVVVEPDEDAWYAYCPALIRQGGATLGDSREEALANLDEVIKMVVASMIEHGEPIPEEPTGPANLSGLTSCAHGTGN